MMANTVHPGAACAAPVTANTVHPGAARAALIALVRLGVIGLLGLLAGCGAAAPEADVSVRGLAGVTVERLELARPGTQHAVDVRFFVRNASTATVSVEVRGRWLTDRGLERGGFESVREVPPGGEVLVSGASTSAEVARLELVLAPAGPPVPEWARGLLTAASSGAVGAGVAWTPSPTLAEIPAWTPRGLANGQPFEARTSYFLRTPEGWQLRLADAAYDPLRPATAPAEVQTVHVDLGAEPEAGFVVEHGGRYGGAMFQIRRDAAADSTTSWNTEFALALAIDAWSRAPWDPAAGFQVGGRASGRIYVTFAQGASPIRASFVAGRFEDVPIVYYGPPGD